MEEFFDFKSWDSGIVYSKEDLVKKIKKLDFFNKKIVDIAMVGNDSLLDKSFFVDYYNNLKCNNVYNMKRTVTLEDFNKDDTELVHVVSDYPIIFRLEDGSTLETLFLTEGKYGIGMNTIPFDKKIKQGNNIDISTLFDSIKGKKIINYRITDLTPNDGGYVQVDQKKLTGTPIKNFELILDDGSSLWFGHSALYILNNGKFEKINFFNYIKCIYNYKKYFSKVSLDRYTEEEKRKIKDNKEIDFVKKSLGQ